MSASSVQGEERNRLRSLRRKDFLRREIILTLMVKAIVIYGLWYAFFSDPIDDNLTDIQVGNVLLGSPQADNAPLAEDIHTQQISGFQHESSK